MTSSQSESVRVSSQNQLHGIISLIDCACADIIDASGAGGGGRGGGGGGGGGYTGGGALTVLYGISGRSSAI